MRMASTALPAVAEADCSGSPGGGGKTTEREISINDVHTSLSLYIFTSFFYLERFSGFLRTPTENFQLHVASEKKQR